MAKGEYAHSHKSIAVSFKFLAPGDEENAKYVFVELYEVTFDRPEAINAE
jgi:hypothetical protein